MTKRACIVPTCPGMAIPGGSRCPDHIRSNWDRWKQKKAERVAYYKSSEWKERRRRQLREHPTCAMCGAPATDADHVENLAAGGDPDGELQSLCEPCHRQKTASEGGRAAKAKRRGR